MSEVTIRESNHASTPNQRYARHAASPPVDVFESADDVVVVVDVPGIPGDAIDVRVENDTLTIETRRQPEGEGGAPALAREYDDVDYVRTFRIPAGIDTAQIQAESKQGTLVVRLPKAAAAKPRKVAVRAS